MNKQLFSIFLMVPFLGFTQPILKEPTIDFGVSKALADFRSAVINDIQYQLKFDIPALKSEEIKANELLSFYLLKNEFPLQLDFKAQQKSNTKN